MMYNNKTLAGALMFFGTAVFLMGIIVSEALFPGYTVSRMLSDLGVGSTAIIYNSGIFISGILLIVSAFLLRKEGVNIFFAVLMTLAGLGAAGVGLFPENIVIPHTIAAMTVFICGGIAAILSARVFRTPWAWFSILLGIITLAALVLLGAKIYLGLAEGGMERMIAYPFIIWALGTGGYLMAAEK